VEDADGDCIDSCWGFYGWKESEKYMKKEAKDAIDYAVTHRKDEDGQLQFDFSKA
jgi:hypothetical protein